MMLLHTKLASKMAAGINYYLHLDQWQDDESHRHPEGPQKVYKRILLCPVIHTLHIHYITCTLYIHGWSTFRKIVHCTSATGQSKNVTYMRAIHVFMSYDLQYC